MSTSMVLCESSIFIRRSSVHSPTRALSSLPRFTNSTGGTKRRRRPIGLLHSSRPRRSWWENFFLQDDGNWLGLGDGDMLDLEESSSEEEDLSDEEKFEAWKRRAEAILELREAQEDIRNQESRKWEDWLVEGSADSHSDSEWVGGSYTGDGGGNGGGFGGIISDKGFVDSVRDLVLGREDDDDLLYEDRVFRYASFNSAKFLAVLLIIPLALDFVVHDYVLMPFLDRYVATVPLAAKMLDVRRDQKLEMVKELNTERARFRFEVEIGKAPPLSDDEVWLELRHKAGLNNLEVLIGYFALGAFEQVGFMRLVMSYFFRYWMFLSHFPVSMKLELQDEWRLRNRRAFANIWSDMIFGISLFILLYFNQSQVALLKFTGYKIINNISDTGKAFLIILVTDIFLGYHSESGWQTLLEVILGHYGLEVDQAAITIFVCLIPVVMDACVKLWLFKFLPRLSPRVTNIFHEMKRH